MAQGRQADCLWSLVIAERKKAARYRRGCERRPRSNPLRTCGGTLRCFSKIFPWGISTMFSQDVWTTYHKDLSGAKTKHDRVARHAIVTRFALLVWNRINGLRGKVALLKQLSTQFDIPKRPQYCRAAQRPPWCGKYAVLRIVLTWSIEKRQATCKDNASSFCKDYVIRVVAASL